VVVALVVLALVHNHMVVVVLVLVRIRFFQQFLVAVFWEFHVLVQ
jgi:hypothetical protein